MKVKWLISIFTILIVVSGCNVAKQVGGAYNMTQCKYEYNSMSNLNFAGIDLSKGLTVMSAAQVTSALAGKKSSLPLNFTVNLDVTNPNETPALLHGLQYILQIDGIDFTNGTVNQALNIGAGSTQLLPLTIGFDLASFLKSDTHNTVENIVKNFIGIGNEKSKVTLQLKPSFMIGNRAVSSPVYIPVSFSFGGK